MHSKTLRVVFRADASLQIGTGHVMRCLTLAATLREQGTECHFLCREHPGHLVETIKACGFAVHPLPLDDPEDIRRNTQRLPAALSHAHWLGTSWQRDAEACRNILEQLEPGWLVVDHYALDARWEEAVLNDRTHLLVIDDLADRKHYADLLLDQNLGRRANDYASLLPEHCRVLLGPHYALLRPEFPELRQFSLIRRQSFQLKRLLVNLGGVDKDNATGEVLEALKACHLPGDIEITVVMGATAPWREAVRAQADGLPWATEVVFNVNDMAQRMAEADLAIGAAGSTSWERCCLGLPTLLLVLAENQQPIAQALHEAGAATCIGRPDQLDRLALLLAALQTPVALRAMSDEAARLTAGNGARTLCRIISQETIEA